MASATCKKGFHPRKRYTRKAYTRKTKTRVASVKVRPTTCVRGYTGPGKGIGHLKKGALSRYGYGTFKSARSRHIALNAAAKHDGPLTVYRRLNALAVYTKHTAPATSKAALADRAYIGENFGYKAGGK
uniref:Uncharacterized protein n=1 Tax=viral metagenome TaxID=1070528 RepID=A0A6C0CK80_9ZZZZ